MNEVDYEKICGNCEYWVPLYIKSERGFEKFSCGICHKPNCRFGTKNSFKSILYSCDNWLLNKDTDKYQDKDLKRTLLNLIRRVEKLAELLEFDAKGKNKE